MQDFEKTEKVPDITLSQLGSSKECWMGCKGRVFDVSSNEMYNKDGAYHLFVNRDASVALAKMKFDKEYLDPAQNHWSKNLNEEELNILEDWLNRFISKYPLVGYIKDDRKLKNE